MTSAGPSRHPTRPQSCSTFHDAYLDQRIDGADTHRKETTVLDVKIAGGSVVDGTGTARQRADLGIKDGRVVQIGDVDEAAARTIDASGLIIAPGFVDIHTHYDAQAFWDPALTPSPLHGVTTVVGGNCGFTIAPLAPSEADYLMRMLSRVEGMPLESLAAGVPWDWQTFGEYLDRLDGTLAVNAGFLVGHSALRRVAMGDRSHEPATDEHVALRAAMSASAGRPLNWNVLVVGGGSDTYQAQLAASDRAAEQGGRVLALTVRAVMQLHLNFRSGFLFDALPGWGPTMALPDEEKMRALTDPDVRRRLRESAESDTGLFRAMLRWDRLQIGETFAPANQALSGRTVADVAAERGADPFDALLDVVVADDLRTVLMPPARGDDPESWRLRSEAWRDPRVVVGASDAGAHLDMLATFSYSTSLLAANRAHELLPLEEAVHLLPH